MTANTQTAAAPRQAVQLDLDRAEAFAGQVGRVLDSGAVAVMLAVGHRTGLLDVMARLPAATSARIAAAATLHERYVREWLAVMVMGGIVHYDPAESTYRLPAEHAACLTRGAPLGNLAVFGQHVALMGKVQDRVLECFETGGGMRYDEYPCFHQIMSEDSEQTVTAALFEHLLPLVPDLHERLAAGIQVLDAGCARGSALRALAARYPASRFVGYDLCEDAIGFAAAAARAEGLDNVCFEVRDLSDYDDREVFDFVASFDAVHDQRDPAALIRSLRRALKPGGVYLMQDIGGSARLENNVDFPMAALLYAISCVHCTPVSIGQGGIGLGTMWGWETAQAMLADTGFARIERHVLAHDPLNVWFVAQV